VIATHDIRLGIDMGGTKTEAVVLRRLSSAPFEELARVRRPTEAQRGYEHVLEGTATLIEEAARAAGLAELPLIGVGMPGNVTEDGLSKNSNATCLNGRPFRADLRARLGRPIAFANDANCFALAETVLGAARGARVAFGAILGTGVGGGVVIADRGVPKIWDGLQGVAGEWGHIVLEPETGPLCYCTRRGCVERFLCGPAIEAAYAAKTGEKRPLMEIASRQESDPAAREVIDRALEVFGRALAAVIGVLDPDVVVLGGGVSNLDVFYTKGVEAVRRWVFSDTLRTRIVKHQMGDSAGVFGAALLP
jgi:fructokinase